MKRGCSYSKSICEYNYIFISNLGSNNELHEVDMKTFYHCAVMLIWVLCWVHMWHCRLCCALAHLCVWHSYSTVLYFMTVKQYFTKMQWFYNKMFLLFCFLNWQLFFPPESSRRSLIRVYTIFHEHVLDHYSSKTVLCCKNVKITNEPELSKTYNVTWASNKDSDQPAQLHSLIRGFHIRRMQFIIFA